MPPASPNTPERKELTTMVAPIRARVRSDISGGHKDSQTTLY
jgi:hypothetical protein